MTTHVDPEEVIKFDKLANRWWDLEGELKPLHQINPLRVQFIQGCTDIANKTVADIGCGGGILSESLAKLGAYVTAIDLSEQAIHVAKQHASQQQLTINYKKMDVETLATQCKSQFDIVTCLEMLEHVPSPQAIIKACAQLIKPGGHLFFSTINRNLKSFLLGIVTAEYLLRLLPRGTHHYDKFIKPSELDQWTRQENLTCQKIIGMTYSPISKKYSLTDNIDVNYLAHYIQ